MIRGCVVRVQCDSDQKVENIAAARHMVTISVGSAWFDDIYQLSDVSSRD